MLTTTCFQCRGFKFVPWSGNKILHSVWYSHTHTHTHTHLYEVPKVVKLRDGKQKDGRQELGEGQWGVV